MKQSYRQSTRLAPWERTIVRKVIRQFRLLRNLPPVTALNPDPVMRLLSVRWSPETAHYVIDVRRALAYAVTHRPDRHQLIDSWALLVAKGDFRVGMVEARLIRLLAPIFRDRQFDPALYFRASRRW